jgi:hypothetical protein
MKQESRYFEELCIVINCNILLNNKYKKYFLVMFQLTVTPRSALEDTASVTRATHCICKSVSFRNSDIGEPFLSRCLKVDTWQQTEGIELVIFIGPLLPSVSLLVLRP